MKKALITGVTGQDGAYLAAFLLSKGYQVHGLIRRSSVNNTERIDALSDGVCGEAIQLHHGDMTDAASLLQVMDEVQPEEIYNLAAQSDVRVSFDQPEYTGNTNAFGPLRLLEAIRRLHLEEKTRFYQASTSELYGGLAPNTPQSEDTPFHPRSPYAIAKLYAYWATINYREAYGLYSCNGILFNHESPLRGENFVSRKITRGLARVSVGLQEQLMLGNLDARRDWGHARDYVEMQWLMLQQETARDYVIASGEAHSVREFVSRAASEIGMPIRWHNTGLDEVGVDANGKVVVSIDPALFRPTDVNISLGDPSLAHKELGWTPKISFPDLVSEMAMEDLRKAHLELGQKCERAVAENASYATSRNC